MLGIVYPIGNCLYLNITNRCTNHCIFCIRYKSKLFNQKHPLWLDHEPTVEESIEAIGDPSKYNEIVFCGYGEPLIRLDIVKEVSKHLRSLSPTPYPLPPKLRINTNGQANLFWGRNILPELKGLVDRMVVSLDAQNAKVYNQICHSEFHEKAYPAVIEFIKEAKKYIPEVIASAVELPEVDVAACRKIAKNLGVKFKIRPYYEEKYVRA
ncbi:MAG: TatD family nuclease-associated radical SAM protein [Candidatus Margulisbacteria bacterium]|nr:TatD family nuclease-associated radical SAM protein [Candidatus Margulisiibacteriota bacterium]